MNEKMQVPDIGEYEKVDVAEVMVQVGDTVEKEDPLFSLETDKAVMEIPAPFSGVIKTFHIQVGDQVSQGDFIGEIEVVETQTSVTASEPASQVEAQASIEVHTQVQASAKDETLPGHAAPAVRRFARELGADIQSVSGSGRKGRVLQQDVKNFVHHKMHSAGTLINLERDSVSVDFSQFGEVERQPLSRIQKVSGKNLHRNWVSIPHVTHFEQADITELEAYRLKAKELAKAQGIRLTPLAFIIKALTKTLVEFPKFNASLDTHSEELIVKKYYHIGFAADTLKGLVVPVIQDADQKTIFELAGVLADLSHLAREGKLKPKHMQGGCFTVSSLGGIGGVGFTPIINAPEVAILGVSRAVWTPVWQDNQFIPRLLLPLSLSYDHRVIDGAEAAKMAKRLSENIAGIWQDGQ